MNNTHPIYYDLPHLAALLTRLAGEGKTYSAVFVLADGGIPEPVRHAFLGNLPAEHVHVLPGGEGVKTLVSVEGIWNFLLQARADRHALLVNLGGGAVCDAGGFAASTFKRGIDFVHVPSTLLSMVDASVGGKTGINVGHVKNTVGTFSMPQAVCIHTPLLASLPLRQLLSGYAEMLKHGLVADAAHTQEVLVCFRQEGVPPVALIRRSVGIKESIVSHDPYETGERKLLNFGHSIGHGLESYLADVPGREILHGEAVAAGMLAEMWISAQTTSFPPAELDRWTHELRPLTWHVYITQEDIPAILQKIDNDKKNDHTGIGVTLLEAPGKAVWGKTVPKEVVEEALRFLVGSGSRQ